MREREENVVQGLKYIIEGRTMRILSNSNNYAKGEITINDNGDSITGIVYDGKPKFKIADFSSCINQTGALHLRARNKESLSNGLSHLAIGYKKYDSTLLLGLENQVTRLLELNNLSKYFI